MVSACRNVQLFACDHNTFTHTQMLKSINHISKKYNLSF